MRNIEQVPEHLRGGLTRYIEQGIEPGGFLTAVLCNDLKGAFGAASENSRAGIFELVSWLYNYAPSECWGSSEKFEGWLVMHSRAFLDKELGDSTQQERKDV